MGYVSFAKGNKTHFFANVSGNMWELYQGEQNLHVFLE
jgi:hypothetical protein